MQGPSSLELVCCFVTFNPVSDVNILILARPEFISTPDDMQAIHEPMENEWMVLPVVVFALTGGKGWLILDSC